MKKKLINNEFTIKSVSLKSDVWKTFGFVCDEEGSEIGFVACKKCNTVLAFKCGKTGTSTMSRHMCVVPRNQPLISTNTFQTVSIYGKPPTIAEMKDAHVLAVLR